MPIDQILARIGQIDRRVTEIQASLEDDVAPGLRLTVNGNHWEIVAHQLSPIGSSPQCWVALATCTDGSYFSIEEHPYLLDAYAAALTLILAD